MKAEKKENTSRLSFGHLTILFTAIILLSLILALISAANKLQRNTIRQFNNNFDASTDELLANFSTMRFYQNAFNEAISAFNTANDSQEAFDKAMSDIENKYKLRMRVYLYDSPEERLKDAETNDNSRQERIKLKICYNPDENHKAFFENLMDNANTKGEKLQQLNKATIKEFLEIFYQGYLMLETFIIDSGSTFVFGGATQFISFQAFDKGPRYIAYTTETPDYLERLKIVAQQKNMGNYGVFDNLSGTLSLSSEFTPEQVHAAYLKTQATKTNTVNMFDHLWVFAQLKDSKQVFRTIPIEQTPYEQKNWLHKAVPPLLLLLLITTTVLISSFFGLNFSSAILRWLNNMSLRKKIVLIFAMSSLIPALLTTITGFSYIKGKEEDILNRVTADSIKAIERLEDYEAFAVRSSENFANELREIAVTQPLTAELIEQKSDEHNVEPHLNRIEVRDESFNILYSRADYQIFATLRLFYIFSKIALKAYMPHTRMRQFDLSLDMAQDLAESFLSTDELGAANLLRSRKQMIPITFTGYAGWYWDCYSELATGPAIILCAVPLRNTQVRQMNHFLEEVTNSKKDFGAFIRKTERLTSNSLFPSRINSFLPINKILDLSEVAFTRKKLMTREIDIDGKPYWATLKPANTNDYILMHFVSRKDRLKALAPVKRQVFFIGVFALLISVLGAIFINNRFILPLTDLGEGIEAIRAKNNDFVIPVRNKDEFGTIATAFNKVISEFEDLSYGKFVQTTLLPREVKSPEGYDIACFTVSATDLGGDYHDVVHLDSGNIAFILGDVTGHGVSASIAMAMAKGTVDYTNKVANMFPEKVLDLLNSLFNKELKPKNKYMTLICAKLDLGKNVVSFDNAGQYFPIFFDRDHQEVREIKMPSMPLGAMKKRRSSFQDMSVKMESGDALIFYTDGVVESVSPSGDLYGYSRLQKHFKERMTENMSAADYIQDMMKELNKYQEGQPFDDDVTMIVIRKL